MTTTTLPQQKFSSLGRLSFEEFLLEQGLVNKKQLAWAREEQAKTQKSFDETLLNLKLLGEEKLTRAKASFFQIPYLDLRNQSLPKQAFEIIPKETMEHYQILPFAKEKNVLKVAVIDPANLPALEALEFLAKKNKYRIELYLTSTTAYLEALRKTRSMSSEVKEALEVMKEKEQEVAITAPPLAEAPKRITPEAPIAKIVDVIIKHAITGRASDIHIEPQENDLRIRYRIDGILHSSLIIPKIAHPAIVSRIKILSNLKIDEQRLPQDGRFHLSFEGKSVDFRISTLPTVNGEKVVMRILDKSLGPPKLEELGLFGMKLARLKENINKAHGMLLVTGPTGSGKSTTLYAVLNILNKVGVNIVTLEDPVEYFIPGVNQSQINPDIGLTFASGLRSILRQDPNIIMVGEIRDRETAELAVHSALTGHLVFSTLHTNDAIGAIPRLLDMGVEAFLLTATVNAVMAQRLIRRICEDCKKAVQFTPAVKQMLLEELKAIPSEEAQGIDMQDLKIYSGAGCKMCGDTGYRGRVAIFEVMAVSEKIKNFILGRGSVSQMRDQARAEGMISMKEDGFLKVFRGITTIEEVIRVTKE